MLARRLCIVHDDVFTYFARHATEVVTRVSIDPETGTASRGQLWTEENLPGETVLVSLLHAVPHGAEARKWGAEGILERMNGLLDRPVQLGGKATVGRGRCVLAMVGA